MIGRLGKMAFRSMAPHCSLAELELKMDAKIRDLFDPKVIQGLQNYMGRKFSGPDSKYDDYGTNFRFLGFSNATRYQAQGPQLLDEQCKIKQSADVKRNNLHPIDSLRIPQPESKVLKGADAKISDSKSWAPKSNGGANPNKIGSDEERNPSYKMGRSGFEFKIPIASEGKRHEEPCKMGLSGASKRDAMSYDPSSKADELDEHHKIDPPAGLKRSNLNHVQSLKISSLPESKGADAKVSNPKCCSPKSIGGSNPNKIRYDEAKIRSTARGLGLPPFLPRVRTKKRENVCGVRYGAC